MSSGSEGHSVDLYIYDLTKGIAAIMSPLLLGQKIDGVWHTSIVVFGREYFFGSSGIQTCAPGATILGEPLKTKRIGQTFIPYSVFLDYVLQLGDTSFKGALYDLFRHNCNTFSEDLAQFLCGNSVPKYILELPEQILNTPFGQSLVPLLQSLTSGPNIETVAINGGNRLDNTRNHREPSAEFEDLNAQIEQARLQSIALEERRNTINEKLARKERKKEKRRKKQSKNNSFSSSSDSNNAGYPCRTMSDEVELNGAAGANGQGDIPAELLPSERALENEAAERREEEERKRLRDPPIVYKDAVDVPKEFDDLVGHISGLLSPDEQTAMEELHQYMIGDEGSWALGDGFLGFVARLLYDASLKSEVRVHLLKVLAAAALKDDMILLLHQDRREHVMMNFAQEIDKHPAEEQLALSMFIANMFENLSSSEWLMYISEWAYNGQPISNIRVTTKVAVHCLLASCPTLQDRGAAIIHNLACKEVKTVVFDDVAIELTMAILQFFNSKPNEELLWRCMKALARFCQISGQDVPQLIQMIGPSPATFRGQSERIDQEIMTISKKIR